MSERTPKRGLRFNEGNHSYYLDGKRVQGVTTLIKQGLPNDALKFWAARFVAEYVADEPAQVEHLRTMGRGPMVAALKETPFQHRDDAAAKGTDVHRFAEALIQGEDVDVPERLVPYVEACCDFLDDWAIKPLLVEAVVGSRKHQYGGKLDLVAEHNRGPLAIFDYKTSASGIWPETAFQETAYAFAEFTGENGDEKPLPKIEAAYGVHLRAGEYDVYPLAFGPDIFAEFLAIAEVARIAKRAKGNKTTPGYVGFAIQPTEDVA